MSRKRNGWVLVVILGIMFVYVLLALWELVINSLKLPVDALAIPKVFFPRRFSLENFRSVFGMAHIQRQFLNSIIVASCSSVICLLLGVPAAYTLVRARISRVFVFIITYVILFTRIVPPVSTMLPYFLLMKGLHLLDTRIALILSDTCFNLPFVIWLLMGIIRDLPVELDEAARMDGYGNLGLLVRIIVPLTVPGLVSSGTLVFIFSWNDFIYPLFLSSVKAKTLSVVMTGFITDKGLLWGPMTALGSLVIVPVIAVALTFQRYLVRGLTMGAIVE